MSFLSNILNLFLESLFFWTIVAAQASPKIKCLSRSVKLHAGVDISGLTTRIVFASPDAISLKALLIANVVDEQPTNIS